MAVALTKRVKQIVEIGSHGAACWPERRWEDKGRRDVRQW
jgi:hypothetical protein